MSLDINWSLLSDPATPNHPTAADQHDTENKSHRNGNGNNNFPLDSESLTTHIISVLNTQLSSASRPSFIGPIEITNLDFGLDAPDIEIKDIRDVWRAFDEDDDEEEEEDVEATQPHQPEYEEEYHFDSRRASGRSSDFNHGGHGHGHGHGHQYEAMMSPGGASTSRFPLSPGLGTGMAGLAIGRAMGDYGDRERDVFDDNASVFSENRRQSIHAVGLGARGIGLSRAPSINGHGHGHGYGYAASMLSHPLSPGISIRHPALTHTHISHPTSPARPPVKPVPKQPRSQVPSLQLHINLTHTSDLTLTLLTSLTVRYPASVFMSLPLKLSITGLQLAADIVVAFDGEKNRVHLTILDDDDGMSGVPVGMRLLPEMRIESEIGHSDAHVLRNVGKIERFIADVVRKTLVDELVFPNFHTIAL
jgi:distribution and morphology protein 12